MLDRASASYVLPERLIFTLLRETEMRVGEALALNIGDVNLAADQEGLHVRDPKNRVERVVILGPNSTEKSLRLLRRHLKNLGALPETHPLFCSNRGTRLRYGTVLYHWGKLCVRAGLCDEAGVPRYTIHQLRHTLATELLEEGHRIEMVQLWNGLLALLLDQIAVVAPAGQRHPQPGTLPRLEAAIVPKEKVKARAREEGGACYSAFLACCLPSGSVRPQR